MKKNVLSLNISLTATIASFFLLGITPVIANECQIDSIQTESTFLPMQLKLQASQELPSSGHFIKSVAYATGECRESCREWGNSINEQSGEPYNSYQYIAWDSGLRICTVSSEYNSFCPSVGAGSSECNYQ